jgi:hypothetical protein
VWPVRAATILPVSDHVAVACGLDNGALAGRVLGEADTNPELVGDALETGRGLGGVMGGVLHATRTRPTTPAAKD